MPAPPPRRRGVRALQASVAATVMEDLLRACTHPLRGRRDRFVAWTEALDAIRYVRRSAAEGWEGPVQFDNVIEAQNLFPGRMRRKAERLWRQVEARARRERWACARHLWNNFVQGGENGEK